MKVLVAGDYCQENRVDSLVKTRKFDVLFDHIRPILSSVDYSIVNFEFPIVLEHGEPIQKSGPHLKGSIDSVQAVKYAGFNCCTLANNHILDQGETCAKETKMVLENDGLDTVGIGNNIDEASQLLYKKIDGKTLAVINCCEHEFPVASNTSYGANPLSPINQYYAIIEARQKADYVLVIVHGGHEHCELPSPRMQELYRFFVNVGADAVVNHHQHCFSGYEVYKGKPIIYGLGNLLFDWPGENNKPWNEGYMVELDFKDNCINIALYPYEQCNSTPGIFLMEGNKRKLFYEKIEQLNAIISDESLLNKEWRKWIEKNSKYFLLPFQPYKGRILKSLYIRGILPSLISKKKKYGIINHIECESHLDRLKLMLKGCN